MMRFSHTHRLASGFARCESQNVSCIFQILNQVVEQYAVKKPVLSLPDLPSLPAGLENRLPDLPDPNFHWPPSNVHALIIPVRSVLPLASPRTQLSSRSAPCWSRRRAPRSAAQWRRRRRRCRLWRRSTPAGRRLMRASWPRTCWRASSPPRSASAAAPPTRRSSTSCARCGVERTFTHRAYLHQLATVILQAVQAVTVQHFG